MKLSRFIIPLAAILVSVNCQAAPKNGCTISSAGVNFGNYLPISPNDLYATGSMDANCDIGVAYRLEIDTIKMEADGSRGMKQSGGPSIIRYFLYVDSARTQIWGDRTYGSVVQGVGTGAVTSHTIYGTVPALQSIPPGNYSDWVRIEAIW